MKKATALLLTLALCFAFVACGKETQPAGKESNTLTDSELETYIGDAYRETLAILMRENFMLVEDVAVYGHLDTDKNGKVNSLVFNSYETLQKTFSAIYGDEKAEKLMKKFGYSDKDGDLYYKSGDRRNEGTKYSFESSAIDVYEKSDDNCLFRLTVTVTKPDGKTGEKTLKCEAVNTENGWRLADMYN